MAEGSGNLREGGRADADDVGFEHAIDEIEIPGLAEEDRDER